VSRLHGLPGRSRVGDPRCCVMWSTDALGIGATWCVHPCVQWCDGRVMRMRCAGDSMAWSGEEQWCTNQQSRRAVTCTYRTTTSHDSRQERESERSMRWALRMCTPLLLIDGVSETKVPKCCNSAQSSINDTIITKTAQNSVESISVLWLLRLRLRT
jgi:hypothetical protein